MESKNEVVEFVKQMLIKKGRNFENYSFESSFRFDFGFDSLDLVDLGMKVEDVYGVDVFAKRADLDNLKDLFIDLGVTADH